MSSKILKKIYICGFAIMLLLPLIFINRDENAISEQENRTLSGFPKLRKDGGFNKELPTDIENYLNDRLGFRDQIISLNALMQYHVFGRMENGKRYRLGPDGEFNIIENDMVETYQHFNLFSDEELDRIAWDFQTVSDYLKDRDCEFYYMQCWDKQTIYPEYFPTSVNQYGDYSRTDQFLETLETRTDVPVISLKEDFITNKGNYEVYSKYGDPVHWTQRGAFIGYTKVMEKLNENRTDKFSILTEPDFDITMTDQGMSFYGGVRRENISEDFKRKATHAVMDEDYDEEHEEFEGLKTYHFVNDNAGNDCKVMIVGNSFIVNFLKEDFAESFGETLVVWNDLGKKFDSWVECYDPDIVIFEMVERYAAYDKVHKAAKKISKKSF
ncbi:alginate O-acetyltransferase AlgX-related protein [Butyrivibrio sp. LC3010]|uniref:alginate O-acetyltransferase AlgX-related protein n=1 Tax=Butyrivibrio sp. LC3010 TaxID=1280680 RepID=UPI000419EB57|nr:hypothetical protein [Butyrivibrio sp. LC3010]